MGTEETVAAPLRDSLWRDLCPELAGAAPLPSQLLLLSRFLIYSIILSQVFFAEQYYMFAYYSCVLVVVNALSNSISIPLNALGPELIHSYDQATSLMEVRVMMEIIFGVLVAFLQSFLSTYFKAPGAVEPDYVTGYQYSAILFGILFGLSPLLAGIFLKEKQRSTAQIKADTKVGFLANLRDLGETFRARNFVLLMLMYFMCWTSIAMVQNNLILLVKYAIRKEDHFMWLISLVQVHDSSCPHPHPPIPHPVDHCCPRRLWLEQDYRLGGKAQYVPDQQHPVGRGAGRPLLL